MISDLPSLGVQTEGYTPYSASSISPSTFATAGAIGSATSAVFGAYSQYNSYKIQEINANTQAMMAKLQGEADAMALQKQFNQAMASTAVISAAQNRTGGSVDAIMNSSEAQFNWDRDFTKLSAMSKSGGYTSQAQQYGMAASTALYGGSFNAISDSAMKVGTSLYSIGG